jgi:hypothetical protein
VRINNNLLVWSTFLTSPEIVSTLSRPPWAAGGISVKVMAGVSSGFPDRHATKAPALTKTIALRIRKTGQVAEAVPMRLAAATSE